MGEIKQPKRNQNKNKTAGKTQTKTGKAPNEVSLRKVSEGLQQLSPDAVRLLREVYSLIDSDSTGTVGRGEVQTMAQSVGLTLSDAAIDEMLEQTGDPVSFAAFLAIMAGPVGKLPPRDDLDAMLDAFAGPGGAVDLGALRTALGAQGLTEQEIDQFVGDFSRTTAQGQVFDRDRFVGALSV